MVWNCSTGVSTNRVGCALPLQHQTMSGGPPFHAIASVTTRAHSGAVVTSALMRWKRCLSGYLAPSYATALAPEAPGRQGSGKGPYCDMCETLLELSSISGDDDDVGALLGQLTRRAEAKTARTAGDEDGLVSCVSVPFSGLIADGRRRAIRARRPETHSPRAPSFLQCEVARWCGKQIGRLEGGFGKDKVSAE